MQRLSGFDSPRTHNLKFHTMKTLKKIMGVALILAALFCGMIESVDMTEVYCKLAGVVLFGIGLWLTDVVELEEER